MFYGGPYASQSTMSSPPSLTKNGIELTIKSGPSALSNPFGCLSPYDEDPPTRIHYPIRWRVKTPKTEPVRIGADGRWSREPPINPYLLYPPNTRTITKTMPLHNTGLRMGGVSSAVFAAQGVFLLGNALYTILYPSSAANFPGSSLSGVPDGAVQCIG